MKHIQKQLIIFDLDGTLIDSGVDLALAINVMLRTLRRAEFSQELIHTWVGNGAQMLVKRALSGDVDIDKNIDETLFTQALEIFLDAYKNNVCVETTLYPTVKETLHALHESGYTMAIATNKPFAFVAPILQTLQIDKYFVLTLGGDSLVEKKPSPAPLLHICKQLNISIEQSLMVGDSKNDILAAKAANIDSIGVSYGYNYGEDISTYAPEAIVDEFLDIIRVLEKFS